MSHSLAELLQATALVFCRVGACLVLMPGLSSARVPVTVRVLLALVVSGNLAVLLWPRMQPLVGAIDIGEFARMVVLESISGAALGLVARIYFSALAFSASCIVSVIGLGGAPSPPVDDSEPQPSLVSLLTLAAAAALFVSDLHIHFLRGVLASYDTMGVGARDFESSRLLTSLVDTLAASFKVGLQLASPFIVYGIIVNFVFGLANRMTPHLPIYFVSTPLVASGGLLLLMYAVRDYLGTFLAAFERGLE